MNAKTDDLYFIRVATGTIHACRQAVEGTLCGRHDRGALVVTSPDTIWRNDDLCRRCAAKMAR